MKKTESILVLINIVLLAAIVVIALLIKTDQQTCTTLSSGMSETAESFMAYCLEKLK